jgi:hypothetical protein
VETKKIVKTWFIIWLATVGLMLYFASRIGTAFFIACIVIAAFVSVFWVLTFRKVRRAARKKENNNVHP